MEHVSPLLENKKSIIHRASKRAPTDKELDYLLPIERHFNLKYTTIIFMLFLSILLFSPAAVYLLLAEEGPGSMTDLRSIAYLAYQIVSCVCIFMGIVTLGKLIHKLATNITQSQCDAVYKLKVQFDTPIIKSDRYIVIDQLMVFIPPHWHKQLSHMKGRRVNITICETNTPYTIVEHKNYNGAVASTIGYSVTTPYVLLKADEFDILAEKNAGFKLSFLKYNPLRVFCGLVGVISTIALAFGAASGWRYLTYQISPHQNIVSDIYQKHAHKPIQQLNDINNPDITVGRVAMNNIYGLHSHFFDDPDRSYYVLMSSQLKEDIHFFIEKKKERKLQLMIRRKEPGERKLTKASIKKIKNSNVIYFFKNTRALIICNNSYTSYTCKKNRNRPLESVKGYFFIDKSGKKIIFSSEYLKSILYHIEYQKNKQVDAWQWVASVFFILLSSFPVFYLRRKKLLKIQSWYKKSRIEFNL